jgi:5-methyltetrahydrofolate--homocysteine methyltransferase
MDQIVKDLYEAILQGDRYAATQKVNEALERQVAPSVILNEGMIAAMTEVGRLFEEGEYYVPEMLVAARAMKEGLSILKPHLVEADVKSQGTVIAGTVKGDLHDIGKNLVCTMLEGAGFEVIDLGTDVSPEQFVEQLQERKAELVAMSALLTTTMPGMRVTIEAIEQAGLRDKVKIMVGGAPLTESYAREISADGYAPDASRAVALARSLVTAN